MPIYHYFRDFPAEATQFGGGMEKAVAGLAAGSVRAFPNIECTILCEAKRPTFEITRPEGYRVMSFDNSTTEHKRFGLAPDLRDFVDHDLRDGMVVLHAIFHPSVNLLSRRLRKLHRRYIIAPHDPYHPAIFAESRWMKRLWWQLLERPMLNHAAAVQVLDRRHEKYLRERGVRSPVVEVGNGYSPGDVPDESSLIWRESGPIRILFLGRIDRVNKGLDLLIEAFATIAKTHPDARLTLQGPDRGDGPALRELTARLELTDRVELLGPDFDSRSTDLAAKHDLFVLPSRFEGFGLSALEAMLAARPIVISDIAGLSPHVRAADCGVVVDSTVESIRDGIAKLITRRAEWRELGLRGRNYVLKKLDWAHIAKDAVEHYEWLMPRGHSSH